MVFKDQIYIVIALIVLQEPYIVKRLQYSRSIQMPQNRPEMPFRKAAAQPIAAEIAAISDINMAFLRVLTHPDTRGLPGLLGLDGAVLEALHVLELPQLRKVASSPVLLAEFSSIPGVSHAAGVAESSRLAAMVGERWEREVQGFADRLLTCLWQAVRHDPLLAAFCIGFDTNKCNELASLSFSKISRCSGHAASCLQARLASHPRFWQDLIRTVRSGSSAQQTASQLAGIQLSVMKH